MQSQIQSTLQFLFLEAMTTHPPILFPPSPRRHSTTFELLLPTCCSISKPPARYMLARPVFLTPPNEPVLPSRLVSAGSFGSRA